MHKITAFIFSLLLVCLATACSGSASPSPLSKVETSQGTWSETRNGTTFEAVIAENTIEINMISEGTSYLYWSGSFDKSELKDGEEVFSDANVEALDRSIMGSTETQKQFIYKDETLNFNFSVMGTTSNVNLEKK